MWELPARLHFRVVEIESEVRRKFPHRVHVWPALPSGPVRFGRVINHDGDGGRGGRVRERSPNAAWTRSHAVVTRRRGLLLSRKRPVEGRRAKTRWVASLLTWMPGHTHRIRRVRGWELQWARVECNAGRALVGPRDYALQILYLYVQVLHILYMYCMHTRRQV